MPEIDSSLPEWGNHFSRGIDKAVWMIGEVFWRGKFYAMLAILFGAGILLMAGKNEELGRSPAVMHYRRCAGLFVLGLCHAFLVWFGDMLIPYAICAGVAWFFRKMKPKTLLIYAVILWLIEGGLMVLSTLLLFYLADDLMRVDTGLDHSKYLLGWIDQMPLRAYDVFIYHSSIVIFGWGTVGLMLLGMAMVKLGILGEVPDVSRLRRVSSRLCVVGWLVAAAGAFCFLNAETIFLSYGFPLILETISVPLLALGYMGMIRAWSAGGRQMALQHTLESVGRMALSNYLLQSLIATWIFYGHGLGLYGKIGRPEQLVIVVGIWMVLVAFTLAWQRRFSQGPAEFVLRRIAGSGKRAS